MKRIVPAAQFGEVARMAADTRRRLVLRPDPRTFWFGALGRLSTRASMTRPQRHPPRTLRPATAWCLSQGRSPSAARRRWRPAWRSVGLFTPISIAFLDAWASWSCWFRLGKLCRHHWHRAWQAGSNTCTTRSSICCSPSSATDDCTQGWKKMFYFDPDTPVLPSRCRVIDGKSAG